MSGRTAELRVWGTLLGLVLTAVLAAVLTLPQRLPPPVALAPPSAPQPTR